MPESLQSSIALRQVVEDVDVKPGTACENERQSLKCLPTIPRQASGSSKHVRQKPALRVKNRYT